MFLYFVEGAAASVSLKQLQDLGLGYAFDANPYARAVTGGPGGANGCVVADRSRMKVPGPVGDNGEPGKAIEFGVVFNASKQTWVPTPLPGVWVGWWSEHVPTPESVERLALIDSYALKMCNGQTWRFPAVREPDPDTGEAVCRLPCQYKMTADRRLVPGKPLERTAWLWEATEDAWQSLVNETEVSDDSMVEVVGKLVSANYYASDIELAAIGAFGQTFAGSPANIVGLCLGYAAWAAWKEAHETEGKFLSETTGQSASSGAAD